MADPDRAAVHPEGVAVVPGQVARVVARILCQVAGRTLSSVHVWDGWCLRPGLSCLPEAYVREEVKDWLEGSMMVV